MWCLLVLFAILTSKSIQAYDWFGLNNIYQCHCTTGCTNEGFCLNNGKCVSGWFGLKCQYQNLAFSGIFNLSQYSSILTDGDNTTCVTDSNLQSLEITWNKPYVFTWMRLVLKNQSNQAVAINFKDTQLTNKIICRYQKILWVDANTIDIQCNLPTTIQQIKITGDIVRSICEINISGGRNVAFNASAQQSSAFYSCKARLAVDGIRNTDFANCAQTGEGDSFPYWTVQLQNSFAVSRYVIFNRDDYCTWCPQRLDYFNLSALNSQKQVAFNYYDEAGDTQKIYMINDVNNNIISQVNISQRHVVNTTDHINPILTLCEVEIYGDCPNGFWGLECRNKCDKNCSDTCIVDGGWCPTKINCWGHTNPPICNASCPKNYWGINCSYPCNVHCFNGLCEAQTGKCTSGCEDGYQQPECVEACEHGHYGRNCSFNCSEFCTDSKCNALNGFCFSCLPGLQGKFCETTCPKNYWGINCSYPCNVHCFNGLCEAQTGKCTSGCEDGYQQPECVEACERGHYGRNCSFNCSEFCTDSKCNALNGFCLSCLPGLQGKFCETTCPKNYWGINCSYPCNVHCFNGLCEAQTGKCTSGCEDGYQQPECVEACEHGHYGRNCSLNCSEFCTDSKCNALNGFCFSCLPGLQGKFCETTCPKNYWGINCSYPCNVHCFHGLCEAQTGKCTSGCEDGYQQPECVEACERGHYGRNCSFNCSEFCTDSKCNALNGFCLSCLPGLQGKFCETTCPKNYWGINCSYPCNVHCFNGLCEAQTGKCTSGCEDGYQQSECVQALAYEISWQKYFGLGFMAGIGSLLAVIVVVLVIIYLRKRWSDESVSKKHKMQVYNQPEVLSMEQNEYASIDKKEKRIDKPYENI